MKKTYLFFTKYVANTAIVLTLLLVGIITYQGGVAHVFSSNNSEIIWSGNAENNMVSLMFNVYMGNEYVEDIIEILDQNQIKATFFVGGIWVCKNEDCFKKIYNSGNEIASHGYWHKDHNALSDEEQANEILLNEQLVEKITGLKMTLFAPPSGSYNKKTPIIAKNLGYKTIMWSKDTIDWRDQNPALIFERATKNISAGDLILMHPTKATVDALDNIIKEIKKNNLEISTVSNNIQGL